MPSSPVEWHAYQDFLDSICSFRASNFAKGELGSGALSRAWLRGWSCQPVAGRDLPLSGRLPPL
jgi:hypothetical protein